MDLGFLFRLAVALVAMVVIVRVGIGVMRSMAQPVPEPEPGDLRRVSIRYRCSICGAELKMTMAADAEPDAPRHCQEEMDLVAPIE